MKLDRGTSIFDVTNDVKISFLLPYYVSGEPKAIPGAAPPGYPVLHPIRVQAQNFPGVGENSHDLLKYSAGHSYQDSRGYRLNIPLLKNSFHRRVLLVEYNKCNRLKFS
ncbi:hypothetical protein [Endozoicomonas montiporae]|uniref:hypothetical protein n=1 Tax=Endozoicomonas montiporae TaxID=1027273 RepID=UPI001267B833|nr:hypothetical protein [Endozoicomonas montiporae]